MKRSIDGNSTSTESSQQHNVEILTKENFEKYEKEIDVTDNEVVIVMYYSDGTSQLNRGNMNSLPEGVLLKIDTRYYYLKSAERVYSAILGRIFKNNRVICYDGKTILVHLPSLFEVSLDSSTLNILDVQIGAKLVYSEDCPEDFKTLRDKLQVTHAATDTFTQLQKAAADMQPLRECFQNLKQNLDKPVYKDIEMRVLPIIAEMERIGIYVDENKLKKIEDTLSQAEQNMQTKCHEAAGKEFNIKSNKDVRELLYNELKLDEKVKMKKTKGKGAKSVNKDELKKLQAVHPLPGLILQYRSLDTVVKTCKQIRDHVVDGCIKPTWCQISLGGARMSCKDPNLQGITSSILPLGDNTEDEPINLRKLFVPRTGRTMIAADFSAAGPRIMAEWSEPDSILKQALQASDPYRFLAGIWLEKNEETVTDEDRDITKKIMNVGICGGAGVGPLLKYGHSAGTAQNLLSQFKEKTNLSTIRDTIWNECVSNSGVLSTVSGRSKTFDIKAKKKQAEKNTAITFHIQGTLLDISKRAMINVDRNLREKGIEADLLLFLHDELIWEVLTEHQSEAADIIKAGMEDAGRIDGVDYQMRVKITTGPNWGELK